MADPIFEEPRLAEIYDALDPDRSDLDAYAALAEEFGAGTVLDVGCGTGTLACPSPDVGGGHRHRPGRGLPPRRPVQVGCRPGPLAERRCHESAPAQVDLVTMTGNVARVFVTEQEWRQRGR